MNATKHIENSDLRKFTFKISGVKALGPLDENAVTRGAGSEPNVVLAAKILDFGVLSTITEQTKSGK